MDNSTLQRMILRSIETMDFRPLFEHLADDVVFQVKVPGDVSISGEFRGKQAVIDYFTHTGAIAPFRMEKSLEFFGRDERLVAAGEDRFPIRTSGVTGCSEYALVFDLREGRITRFLIIQDVSFNIGTDIAG